MCCLVHYERLGQPATLSIPRPDHYFPLLYPLGLKPEQDALTYPIERMSYGSTSMRSVLIGQEDYLLPNSDFFVQ